MVVCYHSINNLKGASTTALTGKQMFSFPETEIALVAKSLEIAKLYITKNPQFFQSQQSQQQDLLLQKIEKAINIIAGKNNNNQQSIKGASSNNNMCYKKQSLINLLSQFNLT